MRNERPDPLDTLIDSAARQMVAGEPSSSLRSVVRDRVERQRSPWRLTPALAGVAAAVVIAAVLVGRALLPDPVGRTLSGPAGERDNVRPTIELAGPTIDVDAPQVVDQVRQLQATRLTRRLADDVAALPQEEEPPIPPIAIEPLVTVQIAVESSGVMPIEIEPLQMEPLRGVE